jgi:hypothetical protein
VTDTQKFSPGTIVEVDLDLSRPNADLQIEVNLSGRCRLYVVGFTQDSSGTPIYTVSDLPVLFPEEDLEQQRYRSLATVLEYTHEEDLKSVDVPIRTLHQNLDEWVGSHFDKWGYQALGPCALSS